MAFPSRADYFELISDVCGVDPLQALMDDPDLTRELQRDWHSRTAQACVFAAYLNHSRHKEEETREEFGWSRYVETAALRPAVVSDWTNLRGSVEYAIQNPDAEGLSLLFPRISSPNDLAGLLLGTRNHLGWNVRTVEGPVDSLYEVKMTVEVAQGVQSIALVFGPFDFMPPTRIAPLVEIAFRPKAKPSELQSERLNPNSSEAHLADQNISFSIHKSVHDQFWDATQERHRKFEAGSAKKANAHLSSLLPRAAWDELDSSE